MTLRFYKGTTAAQPRVAFLKALVEVRDYQGKRVNPPTIGLISKVIPLKLFLDMVTSSSDDVTRAMPGQPKRLSRNYLQLR